MIEVRRGTPALIALALILAITASWWALALWPLPDTAPDWLTRTRLVCFGAARDSLPDGGGWVVLVGQPVGMILLLVLVWGDDLRAGMRRVLERVSGQLTVGITAAAIVAGLVGVVVRVRDASATAVVTNAEGAQLTRISDVPAALSLVDQRGDTVTLARYYGRAVLVTFAFAHCETVCPLIVNNVLEARDQLAAKDPERTPAILVVTLDPWRDTPSRLPAIAKQWGVSGDAHVLSGRPEQVEHVLSRWRIPRVRNERTGDLSHPALVYVIAPNGRIAYVVNGSAEQIQTAVRAL